MFNHKHYVSIWQTQGQEKAEEYRNSVTKVQEVKAEEKEENQMVTGEAGSEEEKQPAAGVSQTSKQDYIDILEKAGIQYDVEDSEDALKNICEANNLL